jgi:hypothetical protein
MGAEIASHRRDRRTPQGKSRTGAVTPSAPGRPGPRVQTDGRDVQPGVDHPDPLLSRRDTGPVRPSGQSGRNGGEQPDTDETSSRRTAVEVAEDARQIQDGGGRPHSEGDVGQRRMERLPQPRPAENRPGPGRLQRARQSAEHRHGGVQPSGSSHGEGAADGRRGAGRRRHRHDGRLPRNRSGHARSGSSTTVDLAHHRAPAVRGRRPRDAVGGSPAVPLCRPLGRAHRPPCAPAPGVTGPPSGGAP